MHRNLILAIGALLWALVAVAAVVHVLIGAWITTAVTAIVGVTWTVLRVAPWSPLNARLRTRDSQADATQGSNSIESITA